jgi:hypothetical protein
MTTFVVTHHVRQIESFVWDIDYKTTVTREEFEDICEDLVPRYAQPILDALEGTDLSLVSHDLLRLGYNDTNFGFPCSLMSRLLFSLEVYLGSQWSRLL